MKRFGKLITLVLVVAMALSLMSVAALAADSSDYKDVVAGKWYVQYVDWALEHEFMTGISDTEWAPNTATTRGMVIQTLYKMAGAPEVEGDSPFADVAEGKYYTNAVKWAVKAGVASGKSTDSFKPNDVLTRQEAATFFCAFAKNVWELDVTDVSGMNKFPDNADVANYAKDAMGWAVKANVISGSKENDKVLLMPKRDITRAELAAMLKALSKLEPQPEPTPTVAPETAEFSDITITLTSEDKDESVANKTFHIRGVDKNGNAVTVGGKTDKNGVLVLKHVPVTGDSAYELTEDGLDPKFVNIYPMAVKVSGEKTNIDVVHQYKQKLVRIFVKTEDVWSTLEGIEVKLSGKTTKGQEISVVTSTDKQGRADFNVPVGEYKAEFNNLPDQYVGDTTSGKVEEDAPTYEANAKESDVATWGVLNIKLKTCAFEVALVDEDNKPVKINNVKLTLSGKLASGARAPRNSVVTDQNGIAKFNGIPYSDAAGFTMSVANKTLKAGGDEYEVVAIKENPVVVNAATHDKVFVVLKKVTKGIFNIKVVNDEGVVLPDVTVGIKDSKGNVKEAKTDDDGIASFKNLDAGKYQVEYQESIKGYTINEKKLVSEKIVDKDDTSKKLDIEVKNKEVVEKTLVYDHDTANLKVIVKDEDGKFVKNAVVQATVWYKTDSDEEAVYTTQQTDKNGEAMYNGDELFTGVYFAVVKEAPAQYSLDGQVCDPAVVKLEKGDTDKSITITLKKARGSIDVVVEKDDGERTLSGLTVELKGKAKDGSDVSVSAVTDKDGVASFSDVLVGSYKISIATAAGDKEKGQEYKLVDDATAVINEGENEAVTVKAKLVGTEDTEA
jgi:hypothetical protein